MKVELVITLVVPRKTLGTMNPQQKKNSGKTDGTDTKSHKLKPSTMRSHKQSKTSINNPSIQ